jgi:hypothetical protein
MINLFTGKAKEKFGLFCFELTVDWYGSEEGPNLKLIVSVD